MKKTEPSSQARLDAIRDAVSYMQHLVDDAVYDYECAETDADRARIVEALQATVQSEADAISARAAEHTHI